MGPASSGMHARPSLLPVRRATPGQMQMTGGRFISAGNVTGITLSEATFGAVSGVFTCEA
jgi:hypothetical protein